MTRTENEITVILAYLRTYPDRTLAEISAATGISKTRCSRAIYAGRESECITVPVRRGEWRYRIAECVADTIPGVRDQNKQIRTRGRSLEIVAGHQRKIAQTARDVDIADLTQRAATMVVAQSDFLEAAMKVASGP